MKLHVDATDAPRRILHATMSIPAKPGPMTLLYPEWIPGEHGPTGPIINLVGLKINGGRKTIAWKRDAVNMYAFHVTVPAGGVSLDVAFDFISAAGSRRIYFRRFGDHRTGRAELESGAALSGRRPSDQMRLQAELARAEWMEATGRRCPSPTNPATRSSFNRRSLTTLVDSPVSAGAHYRTIELGTHGTTPLSASGRR